MIKIASNFIMIIRELVEDQKLLDPILNRKLLRSGAFLVVTLIILLKELLSTTLKETFLATSN